MSDNSPRELPESVAILIQRWLDQSMTEEEAQRFAAMLDEDPSVRETLGNSLYCDLLFQENFDRLRRLQTTTLEKWSPEMELDSLLQGCRDIISKQREAEESKVHSDQWNWSEIEDCLTIERNAKPVRPVIIPEEKPRPKKKLSWLFFWKSKKSSPEVSPQPKIKEAPKATRGFFIRLGLFIAFISWLTWQGTWENSTPDVEEVSADPEPLARVVELLNINWDSEEVSYKRGQEIGPSKFQYRSGSLRLVLNNGVDLILEGPCTFVLNSNMSGFCSQGKVSANVPSPANGFEITTPFAKIVDRGTAFVIDISREGVDVDVVKGKVEVAPPTGTANIVPLVQGSAVRVASYGKTTRRPAVRESFFDRDSFNKQIYRQAKTTMIQMEDKYSRLNQNPDLALRLDFNREGFASIENLSRSKTNRVQNLRFLGGKSTDGFLYHTKAVAFYDSQDGIGMSLPGDLNSITLATCIRIERFKNTGNVLFAGNNILLEAGVPLWQITRQGSCQFQISGGQGRPTDIYDSDFSELMTRYGTWVHLAVVLDASHQTVTHYIDGKQVKKQSWKNIIPLKMEDSTLGNIFQKENTVNNRQLGCAMGYFMLFNRALSSKEIESLAKVN